MPLAPIPPWLNVGPTDYLQAVQAGTQTGLQIAEMQNRARELAANRAMQMQEIASRQALAREQAARQAWEFNEQLRQSAELAAAKREMEQQRLAQQGAYQTGLLNWHNEQARLNAEKAAQQAENQSNILGLRAENLDLSRARAEEAARHNAEMERLRGQSSISPTTAFNATVDPVKWAFAQSVYGPEATNLINIAKSGFIPKSTTESDAITNAPSAGTLQLKVLDKDTARQLLEQAGWDKQKARDLAKQLGYTF